MKRNFDQFENGYFYGISSYLKQRFGRKIVKLSLDAGFTCPNRDGRSGTGGCIFCSSGGSGELSSDISSQMELLSEKWPNAGGYLAYFQSHTNTYAPVSVLREKFESALSHPSVVGIAIATRPDCLPPDVLNLLSELNKKTFLWVELGLQTASDKTAEKINRCYPLSVYENATAELKKRHIKYVTHLIMGLPGEDKADMLGSVEYVCKDNPFGIKLHLLNVVKGSSMESLYPGYVSFPSKESYISLIADALEIIPPSVTIHRLTADVPRPILISPSWSFEKRTILNGIQHELSRRGSFQGSRIKTEL